MLFNRAHSLVKFFITKCCSHSTSYHPLPHYNFLDTKVSLLRDFEEEEIDIVSRISYLGIFFPSSWGKFLSWKKIIWKKNYSVDSDMLLIPDLLKIIVLYSISKSTQIIRQLTRRLLFFDTYPLPVSRLLLNYKCILFHWYVFFTWVFQI